MELPLKLQSCWVRDELQSHYWACRGVYGDGLIASRLDVCESYLVSRWIRLLLGLCSVAWHCDKCLLQGPQLGLYMEVVVVSVNHICVQILFLLGPWEGSYCVTGWVPSQAGLTPDHG